MPRACWGRLQITIKMGWFNEKGTPPPKFGSKSEAFAYMLAIRMNEGRDPMEAARDAGDFAKIYAANMGLPDHEEKPVEGIDKYMRDLDKIAGYCDAHPKMVDLLLGAVSFVGGILTSKAVDNRPTPPPAATPPIDFDNVE